MSQRATGLLPVGMFALLIGITAFGALSFYMFDQWRNVSLVETEFKEASADAEKGNYDRLEKLFFGPAPEKLKKDGVAIYTPVKDTKEAKKQFADIRLVKKDREAFFQSEIKPTPYIGWLCFLGLFILIILFRKAFLGLFERQTTSFVTTMVLCGVLIGYFAQLWYNNIYPMGIDLAGGTELIYGLDYSDLETRIELVQQQRDQLQVKMDKGQKDEEGKEITPKRIQELNLALDSLFDARNRASEEAVNVVRRRVDPTGTKGVPITQYGQDRIRITLPQASTEDVARTKEAIETQGRLTFHIGIDRSKDQEIQTWFKNNPKENVHSSGAWERLLIEKRNTYQQDKKEEAQEVIVKRLPEMDGSGITFATFGRSREGGYEVNVNFDPGSATEFSHITEKYKKRQLAIVLDGTCYTAPTIQERIGARCRITGSFTRKEAEGIVSVLTAGSLPARIVLESQTTVGPGLGSEQIKSGISATLIGALAVAFFVLIYYRMSGFIAVFCLAINLTTLMGALGFFKATMTLPGIAGILLTMGMAVDANVLIFERLREELARGRNIRQAIMHGFDRAKITILDSQLTTLLTAIILYSIGTGPIRGFAVTLSVGILVTIFTNYWLCRVIFEWLDRKEAIKEIKMMRILSNPTIDFMGMRKGWGYASILLVAVSLAAFIYLGPVKKQIFDLDFTGGTLVQFNMAPGKGKTSDQVRKDVTENLRPKLKEQIDTAITDLKTIQKRVQEAGVDKPKLESIREEMFKTMPVVAKARFGQGADLNDKSVTKVLQELEFIQKGFKNTALEAQSYGEGTDGKFTSFTITTRLNEPSVKQMLNNLLREMYSNELRPDARTIIYDTITTAKKEDPKKDAAAASTTSSTTTEKIAKSYRLRLDEPEGVKDADVLAKLEGIIYDQSNKQAYKEVQDELRGLKYTKVQTEEGSASVASGSKFVDMSPLPKDTAKRALLIAALDDLHFEYKAEGAISRLTSFGGQVAGDMQKTALFAMLAALAGIFLYLWLRFEFSGAWGCGAIAALLHDAILALGGVCLMHATGLLDILINLNLVAAILTIIGYSVNDTIVTFDRIREIRSAHPTRDLTQIINEAINGVLSRTILTSSTTLLACFSLFVFGGPTIQNLAFTLLVGILVGTYSSIFIASVATRWWYMKFGSSLALLTDEKSEKKRGKQRRGTKGDNTAGAQV